MQVTSGVPGVLPAVGQCRHAAGVDELQAAQVDDAAAGRDRRWQSHREKLFYLPCCQYFTCFAGNVFRCRLIRWDCKTVFFVATKRCIEVVLDFRNPLPGSRRQLVAWRRREISSNRFDSLRRVSEMSTRKSERNHRKRELHMGSLNIAAPALR